MNIVRIVSPFLLIVGVILYVISLYFPSVVMGMISSLMILVGFFGVGIFLMFCKTQENKIGN